MWPEPGSPLSKLAGKIRVLPWVFWLIAVPGLVLPWATAAGVKIYLQAVGSSPEVPYGYFLRADLLWLLIPWTILWAIPHIALGLTSTSILQGRPCLYWATPRERVFILGATFVCGTVGLIVIFIEVFSDFDPLYF